MAPKARTDEQIRRETEGLKWKSASTLDRQRKRKKHRQNAARARTPAGDEAAPRTKARLLLPHRGRALVAGAGASVGRRLGQKARAISTLSTERAALSTACWP